VKTSEYLRKAKPFLWNGKKNTVPWKQGVGLCIALARTTDYGFYGDAHAEAERIERKVCDRIMGLLGRHSTFLNEWLVEQGINIRRRDGKVNDRKLQRTRLAWLNWLIADYESKGD